MSHFPNQPYQPPQYPLPYEPPRLGDSRGAPLPAEMLEPGRRASVIMFILGGLALACGTISGVTMSTAPDAVLIKSMGTKLPDTTGLPYSPIEFLRICAIVGAVLMVVVGISYVVMGLFVRRGGRISAIIGIILSCLAVAWVICTGIYAFFTGGDMTAGVCMLAFIGVLVPVLVMLINWLRQSLAVTKNLAAYRQQWALQQMYHYQQQQSHQQPPPPPAPPGSIPDYSLPPPPPPDKPG